VEEGKEREKGRERKENEYSSLASTVTGKVGGEMIILFFSQCHSSYFFSQFHSFALLSFISTSQTKFLQRAEPNFLLLPSPAIRYPKHCDKLLLTLGQHSRAIEGITAGGQFCGVRARPLRRAPQPPLHLLQFCSFTRPVALCFSSSQIFYAPSSFVLSALYLCYPF
jgi:hypothetical protein